MVTQLRDQGFRDIRISRTLLGRVRIVATNAEMRREVVIDPATGLILRDYWVMLHGDDDDDGGSRIFNSDRSGNSGGGSGNTGGGSGGTTGGDDHDDSDDDDDEDRRR